MHAKPPNSLLAWVVFFAAWMVLFGVNYLVGRVRRLVVTREEILILAVASAGFLVTGCIWIVRRWIIKG